MPVVINITDPACPASPPPACPSTPGQFAVRVWYHAMADGGHVYDRFTTRERAEQCLVVLAARSEVKAAKIETPS